MIFIQQNNTQAILITTTCTFKIANCVTTLIWYSNHWVKLKREFWKPFSIKIHWMLSLYVNVSSFKLQSSLILWIVGNSNLATKRMTNTWFLTLASHAALWQIAMVPASFSVLGGMGPPKTTKNKQTWCQSDPSTSTSHNFTTKIYIIWILVPTDMDDCFINIQPRAK